MRKYSHIFLQFKLIIFFLTNNKGLPCLKHIFRYYKQLITGIFTQNTSKILGCKNHIH